MSDRTFKLGDKTMKGSDVKAWQAEVKRLFEKMAIKNCPIVVDGIYGVQTRALTANLCHANGLSATVQMKNGITPELRSKLRNAPASLTPAQKKTRDSAKRKEYRSDLRKRWAPKKVHQPINHITTDAWDYHPGIHDGIDVNGTRAGLPVFAMVKGRVIDVRMGDWWGKSPSGDVRKGDGIVQIEVLENVGPFKKGTHIGYGHTEQPNNKPLVKVGQIVEAGDQIGSLGLAVTPHVHLMLNDGSTTRGIGNRDPRSILEYTKKHG